MEQSHQTTDKLFGTDCQKCGMMTQYADDATYVTTNRLRSANQKNLTDNIQNLKVFLEENELTVNADKTQIVEVMIQQKRAEMPGEPPKLTVMSNEGQIETVKDKISCRIIGLNLHKNL